MARATSIFYTAKSVRRQPTFSPLDKSRRTFLGAFLTMIVLASTCAVFYIGTHVQAVNLGYKISQELQKKETLIEENKRLDLEIARLKSPTRIEEEAKDVFGLVLPKTQQVYYLSRWDEELNSRLAAAPEKAPVKDATKKPVAEKAIAKAPAKPTTDAAKADAAAKPAAEPKALAKAPTKPGEKAKIETSAKPLDEKVVAKTNAKPAAENAKQESAVAKPGSVKAETPSKVAKAAPTKPASSAAKVEAKAPVKAAALAPATKPAAPKLAAKPAAAADPGPKYVDARPETPKKSETVKSDLPATKPTTGKALAQNSAAPKASKPAAVPATAKNEPAKPAKATAVKPSAETKVAKKEDVLVARIIEKAPDAEKSAKPKAGPALAYQPKEKVPAVMLDPMP